MGAHEEEPIKMTPSKETLNLNTTRQLIAQWNANRLDLFEISEPNEEGEFHGVMRFYFQEAGAKVATKCIRVASSATAKAVIETLVEKFRPDMRMLSIPQYALYEIHENGEERRLEDDERPLLVQLNWHSDDREGRFLLRRIDEKIRYDFSMNKVQDIPFGDSFKRKLSKREKKQLKKLQEKNKAAEARSVAEKLYTELPETSFTRSISNPEAVMRRRRQQKLEKKLAQFRSRDGGPDTGGTLKIYGESLCRDVPYKTLLLSVNDTASYVVKEMLAKYSLTNYDPQQYCLVQVCEGEGEYILDDDESPLSILMNQPTNRGSIMFHVRRRPPDFHQSAFRKRKKKPGSELRVNRELGSGYRGSYDGQTEPLLIGLLPDGSETGRRIPLGGNESDVTEVGSDWSGGGGLQLAGLRPRHCVIANSEGIVTLTPSSPQADIYVNGQRIYDTTILQGGTIIRFGRTHYFRFAQRGRPFAEREVAESSQTVMTGGGLTSGSVTKSPPMSPSEEMPRTMRADSILPATLELPEAGEEGFLAATIINVSPTTLQFKLAPTYSLYLAARYRATTHFRPEATPHERAHLLSAFLLRVAQILMQTIQERNSDANMLAFWMANASELLHFLKSDRQIGAFSLDAQDVLAEVVQLAFRHLVTCIQAELANLIGNFLLERDEDDEKATTPILGVLGSGMTLLRRTRVNAALTIQLFSQLFHFINMAVFNKIIGMDAGRNYCSRMWGTILRRRLNRIEAWAEKQGLELAADCHLVRVVQASHLLQAPKNTPDELATIASSCFKLNSLQLRCLLMKYQYESDEVPIPPEILDNVIRVAEHTVDEVIRTDGRPVRVEEEPLLGLAFLLPEDGYSSDIVRGVPDSLFEFLSPLAPLCRLTPNPSANGTWTVFFFQDSMRSPSAMSGFATAFASTGHPQPLQQQQLSFQNNHHGGGVGGMSSMSLNPASGGGGGNSTVGMGHSGMIMGNNNNNMSNAPGLNSPTGNTNVMVNNVMMSAAGNRASNLANEPEIQTIKLHKLNSGLGLSIVAARAPLDHVSYTPQPQSAYAKMGAGSDRLGIYIKSVVQGGSADLDQRLTAGDQLLSVDGQSLVGITQEKAAEYLVRTGPVVHLEVAKQAAFMNGLATMLSQPSPVLNRGGPQMNPPRRMSERDLPAKVLREQNHELDHQMLGPRIHSSKSVPSLTAMSNSVGPGVLSPNASVNTVTQPIIRSPGSGMNHSHGHPHGHELSTNPRYPQNYPTMSMTMQVPASKSRSIQSLQLADPPHQLVNKQPSTPSLTNFQDDERYGERYYQNLGFYPPPPPNPANLRTYNMPYSNSVGNISAGQQQQQQQQHLSSSMNAFRPSGPPMSYQRSQPPNLNSSVPMGQGNLNWQRQQQQAAAALGGGGMGVHRDLMRQEAKMLEMQDELRRREERMTKAQLQERQQQNRFNPRFTYTPGQSMHQPQRQSVNAPTVPSKPYRSESNIHGPGPDGPGRPPLPEEYKFSAGDPRGGFNSSNGMVGKHLLGNPWDSEQKERELARRKEAAKFWRDQQIHELESMPARNAAQEGQLVSLRLEREFQRRADEVRRDEEGEEEEEEEDERKAMVRRVQEDLERTRIHSGTSITMSASNGNKHEPMEEERSRKIEEMRRKKLELEATQAAEERLVREATKRREEELRRQTQSQNQMLQMQQQQQMQQQSYRTSGTSDNNSMAPPLPKSPPPALYRTDPSGPTIASPQKSPVDQDSQVLGQTSPRPKSDKKSVSFNETELILQPSDSNRLARLPTNEPSSPEPTERVREDPNRFLSEATAMLSSPRSPDGLSPGGAPGVIGAQEVYRDPRWKIDRLREQQKQQQPKPEKLTFKEKMKIWQKESGEDHTPKIDKIKISSKQREIETIPTPTS